MNGSQPGQTHRFRLEWLAVCVFVSVIGLVIVVALYRELVRTEAQEADRLQVQARVVDDNLTRQLEGVNHALAGLRNDLSVPGSGNALAAASRQLELLSSAMPGVRTLAILDARGTVLASSRNELLGKNFGQREYFDAPRRDASPAVLYVSAPFHSSLGKFVIVVSRVLTGADGEFAGVIAATLDPDYFEVVLRSVLYAPDMHTTLIHGGGKVFLNVPSNDQVLGKDLAKSDSPFSRQMQSGLSSTLVTGSVLVTGDERMLAMRTVNRADLRMDKPLVVAVSRELSAVTMIWQTKVWRHTAFFIVVLVAMGSGLFFSQRRRQTFDRLAAAAAAQQQQSADRLELALRGADLGLWDLHVPSGKVIANARERAMLGYARDEDLPEGDGWRKLIHPDDRAAVWAALEPHLRGEAEGYECEHRIQHKDGHWIWVFSRAIFAEHDATGAPVRTVGTHLDITAAKRAEAELARTAEKLRNSQERLSLALEGSGLALFDWDIAGNLLYQSAQAAAMRGDPAVESTTVPHELRPFVHPDDLGPMLERIKDALSGRAALYHAEFRIRKRSGAWLWVRARGRVVERDGAGRAVRLAGTYADINERKLSEQRLRHLAEFDTLTDLPNRAQFMERLQVSMRRATSTSPMALLFLDIDHFKKINDTLGHEAGDQLLKVFAQRMQASVRQSDMVARLAGDEFTIVLEGLRDRTDARALAGKLVETLREPIALAGKFFEITTSVGVAMCSPGETDDAALLRRADVALYEAKRRGRNGYFCDEAATPVSPDRPVRDSLTIQLH